MKKHIKAYMDHFGYCEQDFIPCEKCGGQAVDIHHIKYKSQGGQDEINNLIGLCRKDHELAHARKLTPEDLFEIINNRL